MGFFFGKSTIKESQNRYDEVTCRWMESKHPGLKSYYGSLTHASRSRIAMSLRGEREKFEDRFRQVLQTYAERRGLDIRDIRFEWSD